MTVTVISRRRRGDGYIQENLYDGEGLRAGISNLESSARFVFYNGELLTETKEEGGLQGRYVLGYGVAASEVDGGSGYHAYHLDEQNSTVYITGYQRQVENAYAYDAFGNLRGQAGELINRILYTGQQYDQEMGQYYLRARYYNPVVGRFTQEDVHRGDGLNLYAYCHNNPVIYYDPSGYTTWDDYRGSVKGQGMTPQQMSADYQSIYGSTSTQKVYSDANGNIYKYGDPSYRPPYASGQVEKVWNTAAANGNGVVKSTGGDVIDWETGTSRQGVWDMGHKQGDEYITAYDKYMRQEYDSNDFARNEQLFVEEVQNPDNYIPQTPSDNRKDNQVHSSLTQEEMEELGIKRIDGEKEQDKESSEKCP